ncbi:MAG: Dinitrogenase iron-molybdenum cofactor [Syntrophorhabdus sp. PtaU1.Bin153]|nr:MAG: Dinitrogenase iron-molybdenum cofactor [Syntrophorhabdus sp. PtaU1.Bin153]
MKVCFAVQENQGMHSTVYNHFGSAPLFIMVDTDIDGATTVNNQDRDHIHGACNPIMAIGGSDIDAVVVGGIGAGAIRGLNSRGIKVYRSLAATVKENLDLLKDGTLPELTIQHACGGHGQQGGCAH